MANIVQYVVIGGERLKVRLTRITVDGRANVKSELKRGAVMIQNTAIKSIMNGPKTGEIYGAASDVAKVKAERDGGPKASKAAKKRVHQASAPGEAPANDEGDLVRAIRVAESENPGADYVYVYVEDSAPYGKVLELGSDGGKIEKRPFLRPAFLEHRDAIHQAVQAALRNATKGK